MIRSFAFTTQGRLHSKDIESFLMPTLLADTNLFLWVDLEKPTAEETRLVLEDIFHFHPLSIEDCVSPSPSPKVEEYTPKDEDKFAQYLFIVIHAVDYSRKDGVFATSELNFFLGKNYLVTFHDVPHETWEIQGVLIDAQPVSHPGPTLGYRLALNGSSLAYIPDHEPVLGVEMADLGPEWISGYSIAEDVDVLLHDCQFSEAEYPSRVGWGHSSVAHAVQFARRSCVGRLVLFHHDPDRSDDGVDGLVERARELWDGASGEPPVAACEGMALDIP